MATMPLTLPDPMRRWIEAQIESGRYSDLSDYVRDLIRHDQARDAKIEALGRLDEMIAAGLADVEAGRVYDAEEVFDELRAKYSAMADERRAG